MGEKEKSFFGHSRNAIELEKKGALCFLRGNGKYKVIVKAFPSNKLKQKIFTKNKISS